MAIVKMKGLRLLAMRSDRETLLELLQGMGCVEIEEASQDPQVWQGLLSQADGAALSQPDGQALSRPGRICRRPSVLWRCSSATGIKAGASWLPAPSLPQRS